MPILTEKEGEDEIVTNINKGFKERKIMRKKYDGLGMVLGYGVEGFVVVMPGMSPYQSVIWFNVVLLMLSCSEKNKK